jgi:hypothetical protein
VPWLWEAETRALQTVATATLSTCTSVSMTSSSGSWSSAVVIDRTFGNGCVRLRDSWSAVDQVIFVGPMATRALRAKRRENTDRIHVFATIKSAADFLASLLREGDLVQLKGAVKADHLGRLAHNWIEPISCWSMAS